MNGPAIHFCETVRQILIAGLHCGRVTDYSTFILPHQTFRNTRSCASADVESGLAVHILESYEIKRA